MGYISKLETAAISKSPIIATFNYLYVYKDKYGKEMKQKEATYIVCINFSNDLLYCFLITHIVFLKRRFQLFLCDIPINIEPER